MNKWYLNKKSGFAQSEADMRDDWKRDDSGLSFEEWLGDCIAFDFDQVCDDVFKEIERLCKKPVLKKYFVVDIEDALLDNSTVWISKFISKDGTEKEIDPLNYVDGAY